MGCIMNRKIWLPALIALLVVGAGSLAFSKDKPAKIYCANVGTGPIQHRILAIGESWADGGRLLPELPIAAAQKVPGALRACTVGYSGKNSGKILDLRAESSELSALGGDPDIVVLILGVNDQIQHRGAKFFETNIKMLQYNYSRSKVIAVSPPIVSSDPDLPFQYRLKNSAFRLIHPESRAAYSLGLERALGSDNVIKFEAFSRGQGSEPARFAPDGIHLTLPEFHKYGQFIGQRIAHRISD